MRPVIPVVCGVLSRPGGEVLITQRPQGKIAAGKWEFPGGKIEAKEDAETALRRELKEELDVEVREARPLIRIAHDYSDRRVILDTWLVTVWGNEVRGLENQACAWVSPRRLGSYDLLAADAPIIKSLQLPEQYVFTPPQASEAEILEGLDQIPRRALLRLRLPALDDSGYLQVARRVVPACRELGIRTILDRDFEMTSRLGADGTHVSAFNLRNLSRRRHPGLVLASCHGSAEIESAAAADVDAIVVGPVRQTATHPNFAPLGWTAFAGLAQMANVPVYAIGGVGPENLRDAFGCYAQGVAGISAYWNPARQGQG